MNSICGSNTYPMRMPPDPFLLLFPDAEQGYKDALARAGIRLIPELMVKSDQLQDVMPSVYEKYHPDAFSLRTKIIPFSWHSSGRKACPFQLPRFTYRPYKTYKTYKFADKFAVSGARR